MFKLDQKYIDFDDNEQTETFYFNLNKNELFELNFSEGDDLENVVRKITATKDNYKLILLFKKVLLQAIGEKTPDGRRFIKSDEIRKDFEAHAAFPEIYMRLVGDAKFSSDFINGILPREVQDAKNNHGPQGN